MAFLIRTIDLTADGREIIRDRTVDEDTITVGRGADNDIHLPDLAVEQYHARIDWLDGGKLRIDAAGTLGFHLDGRVTKSARVDPHEGAELGFGSYRLLISQDGKALPTITISQTENAAQSSDDLAGFSLASTLPGKRKTAWLALSAILIAFLAVPIYSHLTRPAASPTSDDPRNKGAVAMDASWSTGSLSQAHHSLEDNCEACHSEPFKSVQDTTCLTCHEDIADHADKPRQLTGRGPMSTGDALQWAVAEQFGKEGPGSCTTCHTEHEGAGRMEPAAQQFCSDCHGTMDTRLADTKLGNAADFGTSHPQLQAAVFTAPGQTKPARVPLSGKAKEYSGLLFPHDLHMARRGGVAKMASRLGAKEGYGSSLVCADCHTPTADEVGFLPVNMEQDCESCHSLVYDKVGTTFRTLQHGDVDQMRADLAALDRAPRSAASAGMLRGRQRPGQYSRGGLYYQNFGPPVRSLVAINRALAKDGVCGECHIPTTINGKPDVMPVRLRNHFLMNGRFDHEPHKQEKCSTCHKADSSKTSTDLLLPPLATCRTCHMGESDTKADVPSGCAMCHTYHPKGKSDHSEIKAAPLARGATGPGLPNKQKQGMNQILAMLGRKTE
ncbi:MAG: cytochrome c3 family protein [Allopontixanthobacter sediminis]